MTERIIQAIREVCEEHGNGRAPICDIGLASLRATCEEQGRVVARVRAALYSQHRLLETNYAWAMRRITEGMEALSPTPARRHDD